MAAESSRANVGAEAATAAASGIHTAHAKRPLTLDTTSTAFPSERLAPLSAQQPLDDAYKTPISPPVAYLHFLQAASPTSFGPVNPPDSAQTALADTTVAPDCQNVSSVQVGAGHQSHLSRHQSSDSTASSSSLASSLSSSLSSGTSLSSTSSDPPISTIGPFKTHVRPRPRAPEIIIRPLSAPYSTLTSSTSSISSVPHSAHALSTFSSPRTQATSAPPGSPWTRSRTPRSADCASSPWSAPLHAAHTYDTMRRAHRQSPQHHHNNDHLYQRISSDAAAKTIKVTHVLTQTVTYTYPAAPGRTLDPAPRGKRRKFDVREGHSRRCQGSDPSVVAECCAPAGLSVVPQDQDIQAGMQTGKALLDERCGSTSDLAGEGPSTIVERL